MQAISFQRQQNVSYGSPANSRDFCSVELMVYVDPAMHVQSLNPNARAELAVDDGGHSMLPGNKNTMRYGGLGPQQEFVFPCHVPLNYPDNVGKKIADLKFTLQLRAGDKLDSMVVDKPLEAKNVSKVFGDTTVTFQSLTKDDGGNYALKLSVSRPSNQGPIWGLLQNGKLLDEKGRPFQIRGTQEGGGRATILYAQSNDDADDQSPPAKWTIELPADTHTINVPVEFKDLAMP